MTSTKTRRSPAQFFRKYFWEGQKLTENHEEKLIELSKDAPFTEILLVKHRRLLGILIPFMFFHTVYWLLAFRYNIFHLFRERYIMPLVMIFGGTIGGMTTEGGGAVAFPVMTLALHINPTVARDFSMMIQSCGLSAASFTIFFMSIIVEWHSIIFSTMGGIFGVISGIEIIDPLMTPAQKKMAFVSVFLSFALALFLLNIEKKRITFDRIQKFNIAKAGILIANGFIGGIFTGVAGSGIDVYSFSILTLLFRINEKVATPTSVVLMAANSIVGFFWRAKMQNEISQETWEYFIPSVIVVVTFAPLGSLLASHFHRLTLATLIYILEIVAFISALLIVKPSIWLLFASLLLITISFSFYYFIARIGRKMATNQMKNNNDEKSKNITSCLQV
uniref:Membrane transporter protein n=1 Tax=Ascaris lumbricoides TaxID=6252 RepID=A0A0M3I7H6_ASCLU